jgi:hypothetical protein
MTQDELLNLFRQNREPGFAALLAVLTLAEELYRARVIDQIAVTNVAAVINARVRVAEELAGEPVDWTIAFRDKLDRWSEDRT